MGNKQRVNRLVNKVEPLKDVTIILVDWDGEGEKTPDSEREVSVFIPGAGNEKMTLEQARLRFPDAFETEIVMNYMEADEYKKRKTDV